MNIYLVKRTDGRLIYDAYDSFVCAAENENQARNMDPSKWGWGDWIPDRASLSVTKIEAIDFIPSVILASFNAG